MTYSGFHSDVWQMCPESACQAGNFETAPLRLVANRSIVFQEHTSNTEHDDNTQLLHRREGEFMPITACGYARGRDIFCPAEITQLQDSITETTNRLARGFLTPY